jgi:hypothetical protein
VALKGVNVSTGRDPDRSIEMRGKNLVAMLERRG